MIMRSRVSAGAGASTATRKATNGLPRAAASSSHSSSAHKASLPPNRSTGPSSTQHQQQQQQFSASDADAASIFYPELFGQAIEYYFYPNSSVPVFCPSTEQFSDFEALVSAIEPLALRAGICKIVPPTQWRDELEGSAGVRVFDEEDFPILKPIVQHFNGNSGIFHQYNVEFHRKVKLAQFFQTSQDASHRVPEHKAGAEDNSSREDKAHRKQQGAEPAVYASETVGVAVDYRTGDVRLTSAAAAAVREGVRSESARAKFQPATASYRPRPQTDGEPAADHNGVRPARSFARDGRALFVSSAEYAENEELERMYWKNLLFQPPMYGADVLGTLFPPVEDFPTWNIRRLPGLLRRIDQRMPGVNDPYLYLGMWKATFAWHVEDMDLYSINYIHFGSPKAWYAIPVEARARFEMSMQNVFAGDHKLCSQFLRHKAFLLSPRFLASQGIPFNRVVQRAGEIVLTFPLGYHAGFNHGFNCAESVNFAIDRWLEVAPLSRHCECVKDSVTIDLMEWFGEDARGRRGEGPADMAVESVSSPKKRAAQRRHAAAAVAEKKKDLPAAAPAAAGSTVVVKRPIGRPRKTEAVAVAVATAKRKSADKCSPKAAVAAEDEGENEPEEPKAKRPVHRTRKPAPKPVPEPPAEPPVEPPAEPGTELDLDPHYFAASLHTPVGTCGGCLLPMDLLRADYVECQQCGLTVHPLCCALEPSAYARARGHMDYKCANCVMDTDQLSCALCAYQNGVLLPVRGMRGMGSGGAAAAAKGRIFAHYLCARFIPDVRVEFKHAWSLSPRLPMVPFPLPVCSESGGDRIGTRSRTAQAHAQETMDVDEDDQDTDDDLMATSARVCGVKQCLETHRSISDAAAAAGGSGGIAKESCVVCRGFFNGVVVHCNDYGTKADAGADAGAGAETDTESPAAAGRVRWAHPMCVATMDPELLDWETGKVYCPL